MTEQPAQNRPGCSETPDPLHIDLPHVDPKEVCFTINKCLIHITTQDWELMMDGVVSFALVTVLANSCMDIIQTFAEAILDVVMPQAYRYIRTYGTFSASILGLTEDRIHSYLGDAIEQALTNALKIKVQNLVATKEFSQLLLRHISRMVNSVLALSTQNLNQECRLPVVFVSGCVISIGELTDMVRQFSVILTGALEAKQLAKKMTEAQWSQTASYESGEEVESLIFFVNSRSDLKKLVKSYIIRMVKVLKSAQMPNCGMSSIYQRDVCIRVGTNTQILTVEDSDPDGQKSAMSAYCGLDAIPGAVPDNDNTESDSESCLFSSVTVIATTYDHSCCLSPNDMESVKNIADELVQAFLEEDLQGALHGDNFRKAAHGGLDVVKLRELTDRIFNVVMRGLDYQIPLVPAGTRMCDTITYRKRRQKDVTDPGIVAHTLYLRTEEAVTRCAMQVLLWSNLQSEQSDYSSILAFEELSDDPGFVPGHAAGDHLEVFGSPSLPISPVFSQHSDATYDVLHEPLELTQSQLLGGIVHASLWTLLVGEMLTAIGVRNSEIIFEVVKKVIELELQDVNPRPYHYFHVSFMGRSYKDIYQAAISDLLLEFGSVQELQETVRSGDPSFEEAVMRALRKQLRIPPSPVPCGNTAKKTNCSFFKKLKKLFCKKKKAGKTTPVIFLTSDQDGRELQDHLSMEQPLKDQRQYPPMTRIAASIRHMCFSSRKMFSSITRALGRPFAACFRPESQ